MTPLELPGPLVDVPWLQAHLGDPRLVVVDAGVGVDRYPALRIPGARTFDIDGSLSDNASPLPHTMPSAARFAAEMRLLGIGDDSTVVAYDPVGLYSSPRAWWMLRARGFERVAVLDGGLPAWVKAALATEPNTSSPIDPTAEPAVGPAEFTARPRPELVVDREAVVIALASRGMTVLDARSPERFTGAVAEPRPGLRRGHMPGAANLPFEAVQHDGRLRSREELQDLFDAVAPPGDRLVVSCGSGVTACVLALAAQVAERGTVAVYDGSWTEWGGLGDLPATLGQDERYFCPPVSDEELPCPRDWPH